MTEPLPGLGGSGSPVALVTLPTAGRSLRKSCTPAGQLCAHYREVTPLLEGQTDQSNRCHNRHHLLNSPPGALSRGSCPLKWCSGRVPTVTNSAGVRRARVRRGRSSPCWPRAGSGGGKAIHSSCISKSSVRAYENTRGRSGRGSFLARTLLPAASAFCVADVRDTTRCPVRPESVVGITSLRWTRMAARPTS